MSTVTETHTSISNEVAYIPSSVTAPCPHILATSNTAIGMATPRSRKRQYARYVPKRDILERQNSGTPMPWSDDGLFITVTPLPILTTVTLPPGTFTNVVTSSVTTTM